MSDDGMDPAALNLKTDFSETISVPKLAVQLVFDALVASMDFGSGFLDDDDVRGLREIAKALGVDPAVATPGDWKTRFPHAFVAREVPVDSMLPYHDLRPVDACSVGSHRGMCAKPQSDPIHQGA